MTEERGVLPQLYPLPAWEVIPPGDIFRVFERGGRNILNQFPEIGLPNVGTLVGSLQRLEEPGQTGHSPIQPWPGHGAPHRSAQSSIFIRPDSTTHSPGF